MQIILDNVNKQKILAVKGEKRIFTLEFPADSDTGELYGVVTEIKKALWDAMEKEKKSEEPEVQAENTAQIEVPSNEKVVEMVEEVEEPKK